jgi:hypothetical protein
MSCFTLHLGVGLQLYNVLNGKPLSVHAYAFRVDSTTLAEGIYELVPQTESKQREVQVHLTDATEDPNQSSEEPKADFAQEGKPRSITYYVQLYKIYYFYLLVHLRL